MAKGPIVRCGPNHLHFNDPDLVPIVYHRQADKSGYPKDFTNQGAASSKVDHVGFAVAKRQFGQAYTWSRVKHFEGAIDSEMEKWISILHEEAIKSPVMSEGQWSTWVG
jgi:4-hydroxyphenylpyruvate dioxygenase-like putative hemolysin